MAKNKNILTLGVTSDTGSFPAGPFSQPATTRAIMTAGLFQSRSDEWATPLEKYAALHAEFHFNLDPCASDANHKCPDYYTKEDDGLTKDWGGRRVFCNPPYGREIGKWVKKCYEEAKKPGTTVVALLPARTDTAYFHDYIYGKAREIRFVRGRLHFNESKSAAPFPSMIVVF
ncbi:MAG: hypothetical protein J6P69_05205 [Bacteroidales bacterium]|nr:hypothetical protein [Bacteroidales bacterium]